MNKIYTVLLLSAFVFFSCDKEVGEKLDCQDDVATTSFLTKSNDSEPRISKDSALVLIKPITTQFSDNWVEISQDPVPASSVLQYNTYGASEETENYKEIKSPPYDSWLLVVDPDNSIIGLQEQLHIFVGVKDGKVHQEWIEGRVIMDWDESRYDFVSSDDSAEDPILIGDSAQESERESMSRTTPDKWAVIVNGGINKQKNYICFWNDCRNIYLTLTDDLGYDEDHIFCLVSDGPSSGIDRRIGPSSYDSSPLDLDGDGDNDIQYSATESNLSTVFNTLSTLVSSGDEVFVFMTGHGDQDQNAKYMMWGGGVLTGYELNSELSKLGSGVTVDVVMSQCYSGAFMPFVLMTSERSLTVSCADDQEALVYTYLYGIFSKAWTDSVTDSNTDLNGDGSHSIYEIYKRAVTVLPSYYPSLTQVASCGSNPDPYRMGHDLYGQNYYPVMSGPNHASTIQSTSYTLSIPSILSGYTFTWSHTGGYFSILSSTNSTATVIGVIPGSNVFCQAGGDVNASFDYYGTTFVAKVHVNYVWKPGYYNGMNLIMGGNGVYNVDQYDGAYGYYWWTDNPAWTVLTQGSPVVNVQEGYTSSPVVLNCGFFDPLGETIMISDTVH